MSEYKVGDVAALFAKPKEPSTKAGKKLQSLFEEFHGKNNKSGFQNSKQETKKKESGNLRISKKQKKRKFSTLIESESNLNENSTLKKNNETDGKVEKKLEKKEKKTGNTFLADKDFPRKKRKLSKLNNTSPENKSLAVSKLNNSPKDKTLNSSFIKKSKHQNFGGSNDNFERSDKGKFKNVLKKEASIGSDESFKEEIKQFIEKNSKESNRKSNMNFKLDLWEKSDQDEPDFMKIPSLESEETDKIDNSLFVRNSSFQNKHGSKTVSNFSNIPKNKSQYSDFSRKSRKQTNTAIDGNEKSEEMFHKKVVYNNDDTLFKSENEGYVQNDGKEFKRKKISLQNSPKKFSKKNEPDFIKLHDTKPDKDKALDRTIFIGNLPVKTTKKALQNLFSPFGQIEFIRFQGIETDKAKIFNENAPKLLNPNYAADSVPGYVVFKERQSAIDALSLNGTVFKDHHITVDFALPAGTKKMYDSKRSIFIGNLPFDVKDESVWEAFLKCGKIEGVRVVRDHATGIGKGFGYVLFSTLQSKENAMALENLQIEGRPIRIQAIGFNKETQKKSSVVRDTFKSRAFRLKKKDKNSRKSVKKLMKREKNMHEKKKVASILQKSMK